MAKTKTLSVAGQGVARKGSAIANGETLRKIKMFTDTRMDSLDAAFVNAEDLHSYLTARQYPSVIDNTKKTLYEETEIQRIDWLDESLPQWLNVSTPCRWFADYECMRQAIQKMIELIWNESVPYWNGITMIHLAVQEWLFELKNRKNIGKRSRENTTVAHHSKSARTHDGRIDHDHSSTGDFTEGNGGSIPMAVVPTNPNK